jgi:hypothetical protein
MNERPESLVNEILIRGLDDIIQLAVVISVARFNIGIEEGPDLFSAVGDCYRELVGQNLAVVGDLDDSGAPLVINPWPSDAQYVVTRIIREWKALGRRPTLGEICWLELTAEGRWRANELVA